MTTFPSDEQQGSGFSGSFEVSFLKDLKLSLAEGTIANIRKKQ